MPTQYRMIDTQNVVIHPEHTDVVRQILADWNPEFLPNNDGYNMYVKLYPEMALDNTDALKAIEKYVAPVHPNAHIILEATFDGSVQWFHLTFNGRSWDETKSNAHVWTI